ncbi:conserved Plasmodium protein, unknown function [Plasmodium gallinaceum]|uniref:Uncharacterized protein n=1 Tax=Plasmodium gallinaceum TaxID=5849 RepID=A0A1J1GWL5_PLAGA|nr:LOW QUALITY PROTEIN: conserved Plasmodium protein, unknown function [Plasmodium gallinaceum]CRG95405.1 conserved Plasmodium protein, unknown function [Plasmodium gallinaceum]
MSNDKWDKIYVYNHGSINKSFKNNSYNYHNKNVIDLKIKEKSDLYTNPLFQNTKDKNEMVNIKKNEVKNGVGEINKDNEFHLKKLYTNQLIELKKIDSYMINSSNKGTTNKIELFPTMKFNDYKIKNNETLDVNNKIDPVYSCSLKKNNVSLDKNSEKCFSTHENLFNDVNFANYSCIVKSNNANILLPDNILCLSGIKNENNSNLNFNNNEKIYNFIKNTNDIKVHKTENNNLRNSIINKDNELFTANSRTKLHKNIETSCNENTNMFLSKNKNDLLSSYFLMDNSTSCCKNYISNETKKENNFNEKYINSIINKESIIHQDDYSEFRRIYNDEQNIEKGNINISKLIHSYKEYQKKKQEENNIENMFKLDNNSKNIYNLKNENKFNKKNKNIDKNNINKYSNIHKYSYDNVKVGNGIIQNEIEKKSCTTTEHSNEILDLQKSERNLFDNSLHKYVSKSSPQDSNNSLFFNKKHDKKKKKKKKKKGYGRSKNNFNDKKKVKNPNDSLKCTLLNDSYMHIINDNDYICENKKNENKKYTHIDKIDNSIYKDKKSNDSVNSFLCKKVLDFLKGNEKIVFNKPNKTITNKVNKDIGSSENMNEEKREIINFDNSKKNKKCGLNNNKYSNDTNLDNNYLSSIYSDNTNITKNTINNDINNNNNNCSNDHIRYNSNFSSSSILTIENFTNQNRNNIFNSMNYKNSERNNSFNMKMLKDSSISKNFINCYKKELKNNKGIYKEMNNNNNNKESELKNYNCSLDNMPFNNNEINFISNEDLSSFDVIYDKNANNVTGFCFNDIIVKDIEEKKMNKLFFEDICVYRLNEENDIYNYKNQPVDLFYDRSLSDIDLTKLEINKKYYKNINEEVKNLIKKEDTYEIEMNVGLVFRKFIPVTMNLSCNYLLIKKNEKNIITCISYSNILGINIVKKNEGRKIFLFKIVYVFKKKKQSEKNVTLLFRTNKIEVYEKIKGKVEPILIKESKNKEYLDIETVYDYIIEKYKKMHILYLRHLLLNVEKILRKFIFKRFFHKLKLKHTYLKKMEDIKRQKSKLIQDIVIKLEFLLRKKLQNYFNSLLINSYERSFINYQVKTNNILFNMLIKEKSAYQEYMEKQSTYLIFNVLYSLYKKKMTSYFNCFINNNRILCKRKNALSYTITHLNSIFLEYDRRIKYFVLSKLRFNYDHISYFSFIMYKLYLKRIILGYLRIRDNRLNVKFLIEKNVYNLIKVITRIIENQKYYAFLKLQKYIFQEKEKTNKIVCDNLIYANNELCNNLDNIAIEKGVNKIECVYKFKIKESLVKYFYKLKGPQINSENFNHCLKYCGIFIFILSKIIQRKIQNVFYFFVLKCYQDNNRSRLIYSMNMLELLLIKKNKRHIIDLLKFYDKYPYLFKYRHLSKIEVFIISIENFIFFCNKKLLLNFLLKLHYLKYQGRVIKAYICIGNIYKFIDIIYRKIQSQVYEPFRLLLQNSKEKNRQMIKEKLNVKKTQLKITNSKILPILSFKNENISSNHLHFKKKYPLFFYNSDISPDCTTIADDKLSLNSNDSISNIFSYAYEDMDQIKRKIYDFNTKIGHVNL